MRWVSFYDTKSGALTGLQVCVDDKDVAANTPAGCSFVEGRWAADEYHVVDGRLRKMRRIVPPTAGDVNAEAERRILAAYPFWKQLNVMREGGQSLAEMGAFIDRIRDRSNALVARERIPSTFHDDRYWS